MSQFYTVRPADHGPLSMKVKVGKVPEFEVSKGEPATCKLTEEDAGMLRGAGLVVEPAAAPISDHPFVRSEKALEDYTVPELDALIERGDLDIDLKLNKEPKIAAIRAAMEEVTHGDR